MNQDVLGRLQKRIEEVIAWNKRQGIAYSFNQIKNQVLFEYRGDVRDERQEYSSRLSSIFGKHGAMSRQKKSYQKKLKSVPA